MKTKWMLIGLVATGWAFTYVSRSQEPAPASLEKTAEPPKQAADESGAVIPNELVPRLVQIQVEYVDMSHETLTKLLFMAKPALADATKLREQVQDVVAKSEAKILETQVLVARTGNKATSEAIHEFVYPTEYEPPQLPGSFSSTPKPSEKEGPVFPPCPTAFETRNLGATLEVEPTVSFGDQLIDLRFVPELVWHTGNVTWHEGKDELGNPYRIQMPDIYTLRLNTCLNCISGQYILAGALSPKDDKGEVDMSRKVMVFVKCDVLAVK